MAGQEGTRFNEYINKIIEQDRTQPLPKTPYLNPELADDIKKRLAEICRNLNQATSPYVYRDIAYDLSALAERIEVLSTPSALEFSRGITKFGNRTSAELKAYAEKLIQYVSNSLRPD